MASHSIRRSCIGNSRPNKSRIQRLQLHYKMATNNFFVLFKSFKKCWHFKIVAKIPNIKAGNYLKIIIIRNNHENHPSLFHIAQLTFHRSEERCPFVAGVQKVRSRTFLRGSLGYELTSLRLRSMEWVLGGGQTAELSQNLSEKSNVFQFIYSMIALNCYLSTTLQIFYWYIKAISIVDEILTMEKISIIELLHTNKRYQKHNLIIWASKYDEKKQNIGQVVNLAMYLFHWTSMINVK